MPGNPRPLIVGCQGPELTDWEREFFGRSNPLGFILFQRNCIDRDQTRRLVSDLRATVDRGTAPVLIDQEGGRVRRLRPPQWSAFPPAATFGALYAQDREAAKKACWLNHRMIAAALSDLGIDVNCAPVLDLVIPGAHEIIGDRAFAVDLEIATELARTACEGLRAGGVLPVIKHIPGHGRALVDSHESLPVVTESEEVLAETDFLPFVALADQPIAMTAHIVYQALDAKRPATTSTVVIEETIRKRIGFRGLLLTDDLSMKALHGPLRDRAEASLQAGCDILLHCNGDAAEMQDVVDGCEEMSDPEWTRVRETLVRPVVEPGFDLASAHAERDALLGHA